MNKWNKQGYLFKAGGEFSWMQSHAANPFAIQLNNSVYRIFFTVRDSSSRSFITYGDFDADNGFKLLKLSDKPVLEPGEPGLFDDSGVAVGYVLKVDGNLTMYYLGWNLKVTVPWLNTIGRAIWSDEQQKFVKCGRAPMMDRSEEDPFTISYPSIFHEDGKYRMWYGSNLSWGEKQESMKHIFKYAESDDGIHWFRTNNIVLNLEHPGEYALSKPFVIKDGSLYKMWYSYRANGSIQTYRIGYAESHNGLAWLRKDNEAGIDVSANSWDSEMISYPFVFQHRNRWIMLYNGNGYGREGFGWAILE
ncbi:MAG: hypothetical protein R2850_02660 [Bacteroidia bacterium]